MEDVNSTQEESAWLMTSSQLLPEALQLSVDFPFHFFTQPSQQPMRQGDDLFDSWVNSLMGKRITSRSHNNCRIETGLELRTPGILGSLSTLQINTRTDSPSNEEDGGSPPPPLFSSHGSLGVAWQPALCSQWPLVGSVAVELPNLPLLMCAQALTAF